MKTITALLVDESGSMSGNEDDVMGGINAYIKELKDGIEGKCRVSLAKFDSGGYRQVWDNMKLAEVPAFTGYCPASMTPLYDAIGRLIGNVKAKKNDRVVVVVYTDGLENCSVEHDSASIRKLIDAKRKDDWEFLFLGADMDMWKAGKTMNLGNTKARSRSFAKSETKLTYETVGAQVANYANTGLKADLDDEKESA